MYLWYRREQKNGSIHLIKENQAFLGGCNNGIVAITLKKILQPHHNPPLGWELNIADESNKENYSFIVDIKPKSSSEVFLCELDRVFGYSYEAWSPIMPRLKVLYNDWTEESQNKDEIIYPQNPEIIYTMLYLRGSLCDGKLTGKWNPPAGTITALLFWPEAMTYFFERAKQYDPGFLNAAIKAI